MHANRHELLSQKDAFRGVCKCPTLFAFIRAHSWLIALQNIKPPMHANRHESLLQRDVYAVAGYVIEVLNVRGHGLYEGQSIL